MPYTGIHDIFLTTLFVSFSMHEMNEKNKETQKESIELKALLEGLQETAGHLKQRLGGLEKEKSLLETQVKQLHEDVSA